MDEIGQLDRIVRQRREVETAGAVRVGDIVSGFMEGRILPQQKRYGSVAEVWSNLLPTGLLEHCKLSEVAGGRLKVVVDLPVYMYELRLCGPELLDNLQQHCPAARIKEIKFVIG